MSVTILQDSLQVADATRGLTMKLPGSSRSPLTARVARLQTDLATRISDTAWSALHAIGAHRWRDGYETDPDRGWSRYRGSRCTVCDEPWEGW